MGLNILFVAICYCMMPSVDSTYSYMTMGKGGNVTLRTDLLHKLRHMEVKEMIAEDATSTLGLILDGEFVQLDGHQMGLLSKHSLTTPSSVEKGTVSVYSTDGKLLAGRIAVFLDRVSSGNDVQTPANFIAGKYDNISLNSGGTMLLQINAETISSISAQIQQPDPVKGKLGFAVLEDTLLSMGLQVSADAIEVPEAYTIDGTDVLTTTTLGATVVAAPGVTQVGTLKNLSINQGKFDDVVNIRELHIGSLKVTPSPATFHTFVETTADVQELRYLSASQSGINTVAVYDSTGKAGSLSALCGKEDSDINTVIFPMMLSHTTSATPGNDVGTSMTFSSENDAGLRKDIGRVSGVFSDVSSNNEVGELRMSLAAADTLAARAVLNTNSINLAATNSNFSIGGKSVLGPASLGSSVASALGLTSFLPLTNLAMESGTFQDTLNLTREDTSQASILFPLNVRSVTAGSVERPFGVELKTQNVLSSYVQVGKIFAERKNSGQSSLLSLGNANVDSISFEIPDMHIDGSSRLSQTVLGSSIVSSSLTQLGPLDALAVTNGFTASRWEVGQVSASLVAEVLKLAHFTSSTGGAGIGSSLSLESQNVAGTQLRVASIQSTFSVVTGGSEKGKISLPVRTGASMSDALDVSSDAVNVVADGGSYSIDGAVVLQKSALGLGVASAPGLTQLGSLSNLTESGAFNASGSFVTAQTLKLGSSSTEVTSSGADLNKMDGVTASAAELARMSGSAGGSVANGQGVVYSSTGAVHASTSKLEKDHVSTNSALSVMTVTRTVQSGVGNPGVGTGVLFNLENGANGIKSTAGIESSFSVVTGGSEKGKISLPVRTGASMSDALDVSSDAVNVVADGGSYSIDGAVVLQKSALGLGVASAPGLTQLGSLSNLTESGAFNASGSFVTAQTLKLGSSSTEVTSSGADLNKMDGVTASAAELARMSGSAGGSVANGQGVVYSTAGAVHAVGMNIVIDDANASGVTNVLTLSHEVNGGNGEAGVGSGLGFESEDDSGNTQVVGRLNGLFSSAVASAEIGRVTFEIASGNSLVNAGGIDSTGLNLPPAAAGLQIGQQEVLGASSLGSSIVSSSLESVGTLPSLTIGGAFSLENTIEHTQPTVDLEVSSTNKDILIEGVKLSKQATAGTVSSASSIVATETLNCTSATVSSTTSNGAIVTLNGGVGIGGALNVQGQIKSGGNVVISSDKRYKKNIHTIQNANALVRRIRGVFYNFRISEFEKKNFPTSQQLGVIAQEVNEVFPELIHTNEDGYMSVAYEKLNAVLIEALKDNNAKLTALRWHSGHHNSSAEKILAHVGHFLMHGFIANPVTVSGGMLLTTICYVFFTTRELFARV